MKKYIKPIIREIYLDSEEDFMIAASNDYSEQESLSKGNGGGGNGGWNSWEEEE